MNQGVDGTSELELLPGYSPDTQRDSPRQGRAKMLAKATAMTITKFSQDSLMQSQWRIHIVARLPVQKTHC